MQNLTRERAAAAAPAGLPLVVCEFLGNGGASSREVCYAGGASPTIVGSGCAAIRVYTECRFSGIHTVGTHKPIRFPHANLPFSPRRMEQHPMRGVWVTPRRSSWPVQTSRSQEEPHTRAGAHGVSPGNPETGQGTRHPLCQGWPPDAGRAAQLSPAPGLGCATLLVQSPPMDSAGCAH